MKTQYSEGGFSLATVAAVLALAVLVAAGAMMMLRQEAKGLASSVQRDRLEQALDSGLERAVFHLNLTTTTWSDVSNSGDYFSSLTATGTVRTEIEGVQYWVKILSGKRMAPTDVSYTSIASANSLSFTVADFKAEALTNTGDLKYDRTVIIMARSITGTSTPVGLSLSAMAYLHRNDVITTPDINGLFSNGDMNLSNWPSDSWDSCGTTAFCDSDGCSGSVTSGGVIDGDGNVCPGMTVVQGSNLSYPPIPTPTSANYHFTGTSNSVTTNFNLRWNTTVAQGKTTRSVTLTQDEVWKLDYMDLGGDTYNLTTNGYTLKIYLTSNNGGNPTPFSFTGNGSPNWFVDDPRNCNCLGGNNNACGGHPVRCWIYVTSPAKVNLLGGGTFEFILVAPDSPVDKSGNAELFGAVVANTLVKSGQSGTFHYDSCLTRMYRGDTYKTPPIINAGWIQF